MTQAMEVEGTSWEAGITEISTHMSIRKTWSCTGLLLREAGLFPDSQEYDVKHQKKAMEVVEILQR